jgi:23S rRNA (pseudouridine1915-N3)-methyltransferase
MKMTLLVVGKTDQDYLNEGIDRYVKRIKRYIEFEVRILKGIKHEKKLSTTEIKDVEAKQILQSIEASDFLVLLDEKGQTFNSVEFSNYLSKKIDTGYKHIVFMVGGALGFSETIYQRANDQISLSKMTFSHQIIRLFFLEQLYRAFTIIKGEPYHNE